MALFELSTPARDPSKLIPSEEGRERQCHRQPPSVLGIVNAVR
jgi:hypothetical protein